MTFTAKLHSGNLVQATYPVLVAPIFEEEPLSQPLRELDKAWRGAVSKAYKSEVLSKEGEVYVMPSPLGKGIEHLAFVGMGKSSDCDTDAVRRAAGSAAGFLRKRNFSHIVFLVEPFVPRHESLETAAMALIEGARLASYSFDRFKSEKDPHVLTSADLHLPKGANVKELVPALDRTLTLTTSTLLTRDWANTPSNNATPTDLAQLAKDIAREAGLGVRVLDEKECEKTGMGAFLGVARGSRQPAKFIVLDYKPRKYSKTICMVGKALTFDSGGISIKPALDMHVMKGDLGGGIAVIATMRALGILQPERVRVIGVVPACENMPGGNAMKPGDIVHTQSGLSIEVQNTDAEGRLVVADGLEYGRREYQPDAIIDVATLTGACIIALGERVAGFWTDYEELAFPMLRASQVTGERVWRMPLVKDYDEFLKSDVADTKNIGKKEGGAIFGALFLKKFVGDTPWLHLDIAGPFWSNETQPYIPRGATGYGPRLLYHFITDWLESS